VATVGPGDLAAFAKRWLVPENRTTVVVATGAAKAAAPPGGAPAKPARAAGGAR
jgi:hypothetical protein